MQAMTLVETLFITIVVVCIALNLIFILARLVLFRLGYGAFQSSV